MCRASAGRTVAAMTRLINRHEALVRRTARAQPAPTHSSPHVRLAAAAIVSLLAAGALAAGGPAGSSAVFDAFVDGVSADGSRVFFRTFEPMVSADTDMQMDTYERAGGQTTLLSTGPAGGNGADPAMFAAASKDGSRVFFETDESLVSGDTDAARDRYERARGETTLV